LPNSPLLVDDYHAQSILEKFENLRRIKAILELEIKRNANGHIDIERLLTRLDGRMPYDFDQGANEEFALLLSEIKKSFRNQFDAARVNFPYSEELKSFAAYCINNGINCISFNYDDLFDQSLWEPKQPTHILGQGSTYWHPAVATVFSVNRLLLASAMAQLLWIERPCFY
jgi:hypothetical protein